MFLHGSLLPESSTRQRNDQLLQHSHAYQRSHEHKMMDTRACVHVEWCANGSVFTYNDRRNETKRKLFIDCYTSIFM